MEFPLTGLDSWQITSSDSSISPLLGSGLGSAAVSDPATLQYEWSVWSGNWLDVWLDGWGSLGPSEKTWALLLAIWEMEATHPQICIGLPVCLSTKQNVRKKEYHNHYQ